MSTPSERKLKIFKIAITTLKRNYKLVPMGEFANSLSHDLKSIKLDSNSQS
jgi:hypothetical protein